MPTLEGALRVTRGRICVFADVKVTPTFAIIPLLKAFAIESGQQCLLVGLISGDQPDLEYFGSLDDEAQGRLERTFSMRRKGHDVQFAVFAHYWPEFPLEEPFRTGNAMELQIPPLTPELVMSIHGSGLWTITRPRGREDETYKDVLDMDVDAIRISNIASLKRFLTNYAAEGYR